MYRKYDIIKHETRYCVGFERLERAAIITIFIVPRWNLL